MKTCFSFPCKILVFLGKNFQIPKFSVNLPTMAHSSTSPKSVSKSHAWWRGIPGEEHVVKLNSSNYDHSILRSDKPAFVMFYAQCMSTLFMNVKLHSILFACAVILFLMFA